jgi:hypothetical protein
MGARKLVVTRTAAVLRDRIGIDHGDPRVAVRKAWDPTPAVNECGSGHVTKVTRSVT